MRLFVAITFSDEVKTALQSAREQLRAASSDGNFTRDENLHLTLAFIGESNDLITIRRIMDRAAGESFPMAISGTGRFGDLYWVGIEENPALRDLADRLCQGLRGAGFPIEDRPFKAHITLVRQLRAKRPVRFDVPRTEMRVERISLMKSERVGGKLVYTEVYGRALR